MTIVFVGAVAYTGGGAAVGYSALLGAGYGVYRQKSGSDVLNLALKGAFAGAVMGAGAAYLGPTSSNFLIPTIISFGTSASTSRNSDEFLDSFALNMGSSYAGGVILKYVSNISPVLEGIGYSAAGYLLLDQTKDYSKQCKQRYDSTQEEGQYAGYLCGIGYIYAVGAGAYYAPPSE